MIKTDDLLEHIMDVCSECQQIAEKKGIEYVPHNSDALQNIRDMADAWKEHPSYVCMKLASKHWNSLLQNYTFYPKDTIKEKTRDIILYLIYAEMINDE